jgi:hypothetical protein
VISALELREIREKPIIELLRRNGSKSCLSSNNECLIVEEMVIAVVIIIIIVKRRRRLLMKSIISMKKLSMIREREDIKKIGRSKEKRKHSMKLKI